MAGFVELATVTKNPEALWVATNVYGFLLAAFSLVEECVAPTDPNGYNFSRSPILYFFAGIELDPHITETFDIKLFHNGYPGIFPWTLIDISYRTSILPALLYLQSCPGLRHVSLHIRGKFLVQRRWYLQIINMSHDQHEPYLNWGFMAALPNVHTI